MANALLLTTLAAGLSPRTKGLVPVSGDRGWWPIIRESYTGAWQHNVEVSYDSVLAYHADFACRTLIASDIAKLRIKLVAKTADGVWAEITNPAYSPVLRKPNRYQNRIQFFESWVLSKLQRGNAYILKRRDGRNVVTELYVLDPNRVKVLVADDGSVYYQLSTDNLASLPESVTVPASEIIHDRFNCFFHPLVGLSPIFAGGLASTQGVAIQNNSAKFFQNFSQPGGILTAPGSIGDDTAARLKAAWAENYSGSNFGKVAVLGDGLKYEPMGVKAVDAQLIEQLKWTAEIVCSVYHVPPYKIGVGDMPSYNNVQSLNIEYYSQCLQALIEGIELCLDEGLGTGEMMGTEFDLDGLLRMDSVTQMEVLDKAKGILTLNERRAKVDQSPKPYGDTIYMQEQDHSAEAIAARDKLLIEQSENPELPQAPEPPANDNLDAEADKALIAIMKGLA
jgi:HK97 family phage portal protein